MKKARSGKEVHTDSISEACKYFKSCPFDWDCVQEIKQYGSAVWSVELCYDLKALIDAGLIEESPTLEEKKIAIGIRVLFDGEALAGEQQK